MTTTSRPHPTEVIHARLMSETYPTPDGKRTSHLILKTDIFRPLGQMYTREYILLDNQVFRRQDVVGDEVHYRRIPQEHVDVVPLCSVPYADGFKGELIPAVMKTAQGDLVASVNIASLNPHPGVLMFGRRAFVFHGIQHDPVALLYKETLAVAAVDANVVVTSGGIVTGAAMAGDPPVSLAGNDFVVSKATEEGLARQQARADAAYHAKHDGVTTEAQQSQADAEADHVDEEKVKQ